LACISVCAAAHAGILVSRSGQGFQFTEAVSITVNGNNKVLSLGDRAKVTGQISKLPSVPIAGAWVLDTDAGVIARFEQGKSEYLAPRGLPKTAPSDPAGMWKASKISFKKTAADKAESEVPGAFVAFLPGGAPELTRLCMDSAALQLIGGEGKSFPAQIELISAVVKSYPANPELAALEKYVADSMRARYGEFESGAAGIDVLTQGLKFVELSRAAFPANAEQEKLRKQLVDRRTWLDRRIAILKAFASGGQWDAFLQGDREFERYHAAFPEMSNQHARALKESLQTHLQGGLDSKTDGDYGRAFREFHLASSRKPSDGAVREDAMQAWTEYSRRVAIDRQGRRIKLSSGAQTSIERNLGFADRSKQAKDLNEALKNVTDAEAVLQKSLPAGASSAESLKVLYKKADVLGAQERIGEALAALDEYDLNAVDDERKQADELRTQLLFNLKTTLRNLNAAVKTAWSEGNFHQVRQRVAAGLKMKADDGDLLYYGALAALIRREPKEGRDLLTRYLEVSNTLDADLKQRAQARRLLPLIAEAKAASPGEANWMSGYKLPKGAFYCPVSLAFQPRIARIEASNKLRVAFEWDGERLKSVTPAFEKNERVSAEKKFVFGYESATPQIAWASDESEAGPPPPADPDEAYKRATPLLLNHPIVDPVAIERLTGKNVAIGIAGNRYFHPFVWEKLYYFRLTYDDQGRVSKAQELSGPKGAPGEQSLEFDWSGSRLTAIRGYTGKVKTYQRTMQYLDDRLVTEEIQAQAKSSQIKYTYAAGRLISAEAGNDHTLDNRNRKVTFAANAPAPLVK
jgi:hypothetical protein